MGTLRVDSLSGFLDWMNMKWRLPRRNRDWILAPRIVATDIQTQIPRADGPVCRYLSRRNQPASNRDQSSSEAKPRPSTLSSLLMRTDRIYPKLAPIDLPGRINNATIPRTLPMENRSGGAAQKSIECGDPAPVDQPAAESVSGSASLPSAVQFCRPAPSSGPCRSELPSGSGEHTWTRDPRS